MLRGMKKFRIILAVAFVLILIGSFAWYLQGHNVAVLSPRGEIGQKERNLMAVTIILSLIVVVPVYAMTIAIVMKYREGNKKAKKYSPDWDGSRLYESIWWGIPFLIIFILSIITWNSSHALDPFKPLNSTVKPLHVQVISLDWKWLFIYPEQHIASVNMVEMPVGTPVNFQITSDTVMNSFWIPNLGSQIYAMPGMNTQLHLIADTTGDYRGSSANISGKGFASMDFMAKAVPAGEFDTWVHNAQNSTSILNSFAYGELAKPSQSSVYATYSSVDDNLYNNVVMKYMMPGMEISE